MDPIDTDESVEPSEEELAEAEALARALDRGTGTPSLPDDALATAALLRYSQDGGELPGARKSQILDDVFAQAKPARVETRASGVAWLSWLKWLVPVAGLGAVAAAVLVFVVLPQAAPGPTEMAATALPAPRIELLRAQARAAMPGADADAELSAAMRSYRGELYAALEERYGR